MGRTVYANNQHYAVYLNLRIFKILHSLFIWKNEYIYFYTHPTSSTWLSPLLQISHREIDMTLSTESRVIIHHWLLYIFGMHYTSNKSSQMLRLLKLVLDYHTAHQYSATERNKTGQTNHIAFYNVFTLIFSFIFFC